MKVRITFLSMTILVTVHISGCAYIKNMSSTERKGAVCVTAIVIGLAAGVAVGGGKGAAIGGGAGAVACALFAALDPFDKRKVRSAQMSSLNGEKATNASWKDVNGVERVVKVYCTGTCTNGFTRGQGLPTHCYQHYNREERERNW